MPTVQEFATLTSLSGCSTAGLQPLIDQIVEILLPVVNTAEQTSLVPCDDIPLLQVVGGSTIPLLQPAARDSLQQVIEEVGEQLSLRHAYRTIAQQLVLRTWALNGKCHITQARKPGTSDHERALAVDVDNFSIWKDAFVSHGWHWAGPGDRGHFNFLGDDVNPNVITESVKAFQVLWNRNNPDDLIDEDGVYGEEQTGPRLRLSPIGGFPIVS